MEMTDMTWYLPEWQNQRQTKRKNGAERKTRSCTNNVLYRQCIIQLRVLFFFFGRIFFFVQHLIDNALDNCFFQVDIIA